MLRNATGVGLACWLLLGVFVHAQSDLDVKTEAEATERVEETERAEKVEQVEVIESRPIDGGFVIVKGEYLPPPYAIKQEGDRFFVNDRLIPTRSFRQGPWGRGGRPGGFRRWPSSPGGRAFGPSVARMEKRLSEDQLLIVLDDERVNWVDPYTAIEILDILVSDTDNATKAGAPVVASISWISREQWAGLVESFEPTPELADRVRARAEMARNRVAENYASSQRALSRSFLTSGPARYAVTLVAMGLVVVAFGNLLSHHPKKGARWRDVDSNGDGVGMVKRNVTLLILLGLFDLACTALAEQAGGFMELNPLGSRMAADPLALAAFKITTLVSACGILLALRRYRGAQVASWWMCLVVTVVALRWLTYNSMFLT